MVIFNVESNAVLLRIFHSFLKIGLIGPEAYPRDHIGQLHDEELKIQVYRFKPFINVKSRRL